MPRTTLMPAGQLAQNRLGVPAVFFFIVAAATPLTVLSGVVPAGWATTGVTGIAIVLVAVGAVLLMFAVGYCAMAHHVGNSGAFYAYIARGIGRPFGVGAAGIALLAYSALQVGLYPLFGAIAAPLLSDLTGFPFPWWMLALAAWAVVAVLGLLRVDTTSRVIATLLVTEIGVVIAYDAVFLLHPAGGTLSWQPLDPTTLTWNSIGVLAPLAVLAFVGVELSVVYAEEARDPRRTVPRATLLAVGFFALLYAVSTYAVTVAVGPDRVVDAAREHSAELLFVTAAALAGPDAADVGHLMLLTTLLAAMLSFHGVVARYCFALAREQVLPTRMASLTNAGTPKAGSITQSLTALAVIVAFAATGADPILDFFYYAGTGGGLGVMILLATTAIAVVAYFARNHHLEWSVWTRLIAPTLAAAGLITVLVLAVVNLNALYGPDADPAVQWAILGTYALVAVAGTGYGIWLAVRRPAVYARIGQGAHAATALLTGPRHTDYATRPVR